MEEEQHTSSIIPQAQATDADPVWAWEVEVACLVAAVWAEGAGVHHAEVTGEEGMAGEGDADARSSGGGIALGI